MLMLESLGIKLAASKFLDLYQLAVLKNVANVFYISLSKIKIGQHLVNVCGFANFLQLEFKLRNWFFIQTKEKHYLNEL